MRTGLVTALTFLLAATAASGADLADFEEVVAFEQSLKTLSVSVRRGDSSPVDERLLIIDGVVSTIDVRDPEESTFRARIELVSGEWRGLEEVVMYNAYVDVAGPEFFRRIPTRRSRADTPDAIVSNEPLLVVGRFTGVDLDEEGSPVPVIEAYYARPLQ
jgi:hypothetical protein